MLTDKASSRPVWTNDEACVPPRACRRVVRLSLWENRSSKYEDVVFKACSQDGLPEKSEDQGLDS